MTPFMSCSRVKSSIEKNDAETKIVQQTDGTVSLNVENAARYCDVADPSNNTADWKVVISRPGRFKVWLSSATKDTSVLNYTNSVRISLLDDQLVVNPTIDKIVHNSQDVSYPFFRADSYMGSIYVQEAGEYTIQVISEKIIPAVSVNPVEPLSENSKLMAVILSPITN